MNRWFNSVSIERNEEYVQKLCKKFNIDKYSIIYSDGQLDLLFEYGVEAYRCELDQRAKQLILLKRNKTKNSKGKAYYHVCKKFEGHDVWYDMFKFVVKGK
jgi:hypothetical protein